MNSMNMNPSSSPSPAPMGACPVLSNFNAITFPSSTSSSCVYVMLPPPSSSDSGMGSMGSMGSMPPQTMTSPPPMKCPEMDGYVVSGSFSSPNGGGMVCQYDHQSSK